MAVVRVEGTVDGKRIIFSKDENSKKWIASVPSEIDGTYVMEVNAYDEAGNKAYSAKVLFVVDLQSLKVEFFPLNFSNIEQDSSFDTESKSTQFANIVCDFIYGVESVPEKYRAVVL